jgi:hypothetical protein
MYTSTFTFAKKRFDDEFHRLDEAIASTRTISKPRPANTIGWPATRW